mmetsp:Transcript_13983/g.30950  ORF Transcript_13983/g.30950 Transcript_13983/m.30950 type:complete len:260 (+) Transcript_13983:217-996(+)
MQGERDAPPNQTRSAGSHPVVARRGLGIVPRSSGLCPPAPSLAHSPSGSAGNLPITHRLRQPRGFRVLAGKQVFEGLSPGSVGLGVPGVEPERQALLPLLVWGGVLGPLSAGVVALPGVLGGVWVGDLPSHGGTPVVEAGEVPRTTGPGQASDPRQIINHHKASILSMPSAIVPPVRARALPPRLALLALVRLLRVVLQRAPPREIVVVPPGQGLRVEGGVVDVLHAPDVVTILLKALGALGGRGAGRSVKAVPGTKLA